MLLLSYCSIVLIFSKSVKKTKTHKKLMQLTSRFIQTLMYCSLSLCAIELHYCPTTTTNTSLRHEALVVWVLFMEFVDSKKRVEQSRPSPLRSSCAQLNSLGRMSQLSCLWSLSSIFRNKESWRESKKLNLKIELDSGLTTITDWTSTISVGTEMEDCYRQ